MDIGTIVWYAMVGIVIAAIVWQQFCKAKTQGDESEKEPKKDAGTVLSWLDKDNGTDIESALRLCKRNGAKTESLNAIATEMMLWRLANAPDGSVEEKNGKEAGEEKNALSQVLKAVRDEVCSAVRDAKG
jgi:hypothetical protein